MNNKKIFSILGIVLFLILVIYLSINLMPGIKNDSSLPLDVPTVAPVDEGSEYEVKDERVPVTDVSWQAPLEIPYLPILNSYFESDHRKNNNNVRFYLIGKVNKGTFEGSDVLRVKRFNILDMGDDGFDYVLAKKDSTSKYSDFTLVYYSDNEPNSEFIAYDLSKVKIKALKLADLEMPEKISIEGSDYSHVPAWGGDLGGEWVDNPKLVIAASNTPVGPFYYAPDGKSAPVKENERGIHGAFFAKSKDGRVASYKLLDLEEIGKDPIGNNADYRYADLGGCGATNVASVTSIPKSELRILMQSKQGKPIYTFIDQNKKELEDFYEATSYIKGEEMKKIPYEEYLSRTPIIFMEDKFGRLIKFTNTEFGSLAECGKPVIYLYPETTLKINVKVAPEGGFSKTDPVYDEKDGWSVIATPEGKLTNLTDGKSYSYLFWEGRGGLYSSPEKGWVVKREEVEVFLDKTLEEFGLIQNEINDFKEFWLPRMQAKKYYFISFYDNKVMDVLAPLKVTPTPDSTIRVLMDFEGLDEPKEVQSFKIPKRERKGFTVVEWGGVIK